MVSQQHQLKVKAAAINFDSMLKRHTLHVTHMRQLHWHFSITEEAIEDNLYDRLAVSLHKGFGSFNGSDKANQSCCNFEQCVQCTGSPVGDGAALCSAAHPSLSGNQRNILSVTADLNETSLEQMLIDVRWSD